MVDQVAVGEAHVGLEAGDARGGEPAAQRRHVAGQRDADAHHRLAGEGAQRRRRHRRRSRPHGLRVARRDEAVGLEPVVDDQRRLAALERRVQVHLGAPAVHPVGRRQDEAALGHALRVRARGPDRAAHRGEQALEPWPIVVQAQLAAQGRRPLESDRRLVPRQGDLGGPDAAPRRARSAGPTASASALAVGVAPRRLVEPPETREHVRPGHQGQPLAQAPARGAHQLAP